MSKVPLINEVMDRTSITLSKDMDVYKAIDILLDKKITSAVVVDDYDRIVGILSEKDCLDILTKGQYHGLPSALVSDFMTKKVITSNPAINVFDAAVIFQEHFFRRLIIADEDNKMIGQITRRDLLRVIRKLRKEEQTNKAPIL